MADAYLNVNGSLSTDDLMERIKSSARERQRGLGNSANGAEPGPSPAAEEHAAAPGQTEINQAFLQSLDLVAHHLGYLQAQAGLIEAWVREETERDAQFHQEINEQLSQLRHLVADLGTRVGALEDRAAAHARARPLSWPRLRGLARS